MRALRSRGIRFAKGRSGGELRGLEDQYSLCFPPDMSAFPQHALAKGGDFPDWRNRSPGSSRGAGRHMIKRMELILANPTLHHDALTPEERLPDQIKWHRWAHLPHSSQVFCISAFGTLRGIEARDQVIDRFVANALPIYRPGPRAPRWNILLEHEDPPLLNEVGARAQPTSVDALLLSSKAVVAVESKFVSDAAKGFGQCSAFTGGRCIGFYGPGSDGSSQAWCQLEAWRGTRSPRTYWTIGKEYFRSAVFQKQSVGEACPLRGPDYQLMRNFLFAAARSRKADIPVHGVVTIAPAANSQLLGEQVAAFRSQVLLPAYAEHIGHTTYEDYCRLLRAFGDSSCIELAAFLDGRIDALVSR